MLFFVNRLLVQSILVHFIVVISSVDEAFFQSARSGDLQTLKEYIANGTSVNTLDSRGNSALIIAAGRGQVNVISLLLEQGAAIDDFTQTGLFEGKTALCWAASQGRTQAVAMLLQAGADPNRQPERGVFQGKTAFMWAASQGRVGVLRLLISAGVDVNFSSKFGNFKGKSALMWASSQGRVEAVTSLLQAGADVNAVDNDGINALMWASGSEAAGEAYKKGLQSLEKAIKGQKDVVQLLLQYGTRPDDRDKDGITAIMYACYHGHTGAVEVLMNWGADTEQRNKAGLTALQLALNAGFEETANMIIQGPTILTSPVPEMVKFSSCGWLLSVLRSHGAPYSVGALLHQHSYSCRRVGAGSGVGVAAHRESRHTSASPSSPGQGTVQADVNRASTIVRAVRPQRVTQDQSSSTTSGQGTVGTSTAESEGHSFHTGAGQSCQIIENEYSIDNSCDTLREHGLFTSLGEFLYLTQEAGVEDMVHHLGLPTYATVLRAKLQLKLLMQRFLDFESKNSTNAD